MIVAFGADDNEDPSYHPSEEDVRFFINQWVKYEGICHDEISCKEALNCTGGEDCYQAAKKAFSEKHGCDSVESCLVHTSSYINKWQSQVN